jgi:hypothetical protein
VLYDPRGHDLSLQSFEDGRGVIAHLHESAGRQL